MTKVITYSILEVAEQLYFYTRDRITSIALESRAFIMQIKVKFETLEDLGLLSSKLNYHLDNRVKTISLSHDGKVGDIKYYSKPFVDKSEKKLGNRSWEQFWLDMPHFEQSFPSLHTEIIIECGNEYYLDILLENKISSLSKDRKTILSTWFPKKTKANYSDKWYRGSENVKNNYPIYIPSLGRWDCCLTANYLLAMGVENFYIIVEEQELENYQSFFSDQHLLVLDKSYQDNYETLDNLGATKRVGPGASRNFAWDHSISLGYDWHWVLDDNIQGFQRFINNKKVPIKTPVIFHILESFTKRFSNVGMSGMNYRFFCVHNKPAFQLNTRIYSCNFIKNDLPFRWRGRYNEDTILSLDMITSGWNTLLFNLFLIGKVETQKMKGGNNDIFYKAEGTYNKSLMLKNVYPEYVELVSKYGRDHHFIDYIRHFEGTNNLSYREGVESSLLPNANDYGIYFG